MHMMVRRFTNRQHANRLVDISAAFVIQFGRLWHKRHNLYMNQNVPSVISHKKLSITEIAVYTFESLKKNKKKSQSNHRVGGWISQLTAATTRLKFNRKKKKRLHAKKESLVFGCNLILNNWEIDITGWNEGTKKKPRLSFTMWLCSPRHVGAPET